MLLHVFLSHLSLSTFFSGDYFEWLSASGNAISDSTSTLPSIHPVSNSIKTSSREEISSKKNGCNCFIFVLLSESFHVFDFGPFLNTWKAEERGTKQQQLVVIQFKVIFNHYQFHSSFFCLFSPFWSLSQKFRAASYQICCFFWQDSCIASFHSLVFDCGHQRKEGRNICPLSSSFVAT